MMLGYLAFHVQLKLVQVPLFDAATMVAFGGMAVCYCAACYCVLHITAGLLESI